MPQVVVIFGPTASGKSALAVALAQALNGEIINADSRQIYQNIPLITACPTAEDYAAVPHHLFENIPVTEKYTAGRYATEAAAKIAEVQGQGLIPIVVGGTGFYLKSLMEQGTNVAAPAVSVSVAAALQQRATSEPLHNLYTDLSAHDPEAAETIKPADTQRILRALGVFLTHNKKFSDFKKQSSNLKPLNQYICLALNPPKEELNVRIETRWQSMQKAGVVEEVKAVLQANSREAPGLQSVGVQHIGAFLNGETNWKTAESTYIIAMRQYAKRQRTWLRNSYPAARTWEWPNPAETIAFLKPQLKA